MKISYTTGWRWREQGMISVVNINGRNYVTDEAVQEFERRARAGEFSKEIVCPTRAPAVPPVTL